MIKNLRAQNEHGGFSLLPLGLTKPPVLQESITSLGIKITDQLHFCNRRMLPVYRKQGKRCIGNIQYPFKGSASTDPLNV